LAANPQTQRLVANAIHANHPKQIPHLFIIDRHVQIRRHHAGVGMAGGIADFGERSAICEGVTDGQ
jgi:hypothetical protein